MYMKYSLYIFILIFVLGTVPAAAMTSTDVAQLIASLRSQPTVLGAATDGTRTTEVRRPLLTKEEQAKVLLALKYAKGSPMIVDKAIALGSTDKANITALQQFLIAKGYLTTEATGTFGPATRKALKAYQTEQRIVGGDGTRVGTLTMNAISAEVSAAAQ